jgi:ribosomal protein S18 acetylase RimI-like enzyme
MRLSEFHEDYTETVVALWQKCGLTRPWNDPYRDIACKQTDKNGRFLVGHEVGRLVATIMVGYDGHRGSINYLAVDPQFSGNGFGLVLVQAAEEFLRAIGRLKINLCVRRENEAVIKFYNKSGYAQETVYYCSKRLIDDQ